MRNELKRRFVELADRLAEQTLTDSDPENWPGYGQLPKDMDAETRGDAFWCRKLAGSTATLLVRTMAVIDTHKDAGWQGKDADARQESLLERAEVEADRLMQRIKDRYADKLES